MRFDLVALSIKKTSTSSISRVTSGHCYRVALSWNTPNPLDNNRPAVPEYSSDSKKEKRKKETGLAVLDYHMQACSQ